MPYRVRVTPAVLGLLLFVVGSARAQDTAPVPTPALTLDAAIHEALAGNAALEAARARADAASALARAAGALRTHEWHYTGGLTAADAKSIEPDFWFTREELTNELRVALADGGKARAEWRLALAEALAAEAEYAQQASDLALEVIVRFYAVLQADQELQSAADGLALVGEHLRLARVRQAEGDASELDVLRAEGPWPLLRQTTMPPRRS